MTPERPRWLIELRALLETPWWAKLGCELIMEKQQWLAACKINTIHHVPAGRLTRPGAPERV